MVLISKGTEVVGFNYIPFPTTSIILKKSEKKAWLVYVFISIF